MVLSRGILARDSIPTTLTVVIVVRVLVTLSPGTTTTTTSTASSATSTLASATTAPATTTTAASTSFAPTVSMARWFVATRGRALSIASLGFATGEAFMPLLLVALLGVGVAPQQVVGQSTSRANHHGPVHPVRPALHDASQPGSAELERARHPLAELAPRDAVASAAVDVMRRDRTDHVWLDARHLGGDFLERRFPTILRACRSHGIDPVTEYVPGHGTLTPWAGCTLDRLEERVAEGGHHLTPILADPGRRSAR